MHNNRSKASKLSKLSKLLYWLFIKEQGSPDGFDKRFLDTLNPRASGSFVCPKVVCIQLPGFPLSRIISAFKARNSSAKRKSHGLACSVPKTPSSAENIFLNLQNEPQEEEFIHTNNVSDTFILNEWLAQNFPHFSHIIKNYGSSIGLVEASGERTYKMPIWSEFLYPKKALFDDLDNSELCCNLNDASSWIINPYQLCLSETEMEALGFVSRKNLPSEWTHSFDPIKFPLSSDLQNSKKSWKLLALDCEMCGTIQGSECCRVSLVSSDYVTVYDSFVKPHNPIVDYRTVFSGVTAEILENCHVRLEQVQQELSQILGPDTILIGHSLINDLNALKLVHPYCIDTSFLYDDKSGPIFSTSLVKLASKVLGIEMRAGGAAPHDSIEDASIAMKLAQYRLKNGFWAAVVNIEAPTLDLFQALSYHGNVSSSFIDTEKNLNKYGRWATHKIPVDSVSSSTEGLVLEENKQSSLVWTAFRELEALELESLEKAEKQPNQSLAFDKLLKFTLSEASLLPIYKAWDSRLKAIYEGLVPRTILIVFSGHGTHLPIISKLQGICRERKNNLRPTDQSFYPELIDCIANSKLGFFTCCVKE